MACRLALQICETLCLLDDNETSQKVVSHAAGDGATDFIILFNNRKSVFRNFRFLFVCWKESKAGLMVARSMDRLI